MSCAMRWAASQSPRASYHSASSAGLRPDGGLSSATVRLSSAAVMVPLCMAPTCCTILAAPHLMPTTTAKTTVAVLALASTLLSAVAPQAPALARPPTASGSVAADRLTRLDALLQRYVDEERIAGAVALVLRDGRPLHETVVGWSDKEANRRMTNDAIFRIASQSKALT